MIPCADFVGDCFLSKSIPTEKIMMNKGEYILSRAGGDGAVVLGFGISNVPLVDFLLGRGIPVEVRDGKSREALSKNVDIAAYERRGVPFRLGDGYLDDIPAAVVFRTPGIRPDAGGIPDAVRRGALLTSEMELFYALTPAYRIAVTGSDGKTTTTTLIHKLLLAVTSGTDVKSALGGNIGAPLLPRVYELTNGDYAVAELSSFQLMTMAYAPETAVITNVSPNHLNWHTGMEEYIDSKLCILGQGCRRAVLNYNNDVTRHAASVTDAEVIWFTSGEVPDELDNIIFLDGDGIVLRRGGSITHLLSRSDIKLPGLHNVENYMAAIAALCDLFPLDRLIGCARELARTFGGVEHRLEFVRELDGVSYYNGSIDSTPSRTAAALSALPGKKIILICGGYDKHIPMEPLGEAILAHGGVVHTVVTGATAGLISDAFRSVGIPGDAYTVAPDLRTATLEASERAKESGADTVLLSPACASFDAFSNFEERGRFYKSVVNELKID